jgi:serine/threonine protein kinase/Tfp pilus assembly protein PilF
MSNSIDSEVATPIVVEGGSLVEQLAEEMACRWRTGQRSLAEEYLNRYPDLWQRPDAALELIAEELALREEYKEPVSNSQLASRFPQWADQVRTLGNVQRAFGSRPDVPRFPQVGDSLGEFHLIAELGRGAHGRVFAATQGSLGGRTVVLKLTRRGGREHLSLARVQHTHIVPLYSVHDLPEHGLCALCMPYFGGATLATLLSSVETLSPACRTGNDLATALRSAQLVDATGGDGQSGHVYSRCSYSDGICRIGICLANALQFAHERGLLHLDVKPSNVLIAADGVPMLLDFHLAHAPLVAGDAPPVRLGGTPEYMAPELAAALEAVRTASCITTSVDCRADIYSLGVVLAEALGSRPGTQNSCISAGLADILKRCLAPSAADRYATAGEVAADLERHLANLPLKGVVNRSLTERWRKWRKRYPYALSLAVLFLTLVACGMNLVMQASSRADRATAALQEGESRLREGRFGEAIEVLRGGELLTADLPFQRSLDANLREARLRAEQGQAAVELHQLCERLRPFYGAEVVSQSQLQLAESRCRELWAQRDAIVRRLEGQSTPELERQWRSDLLDIGILAANLQIRTASPQQAENAHRRSLVILDEAESLLGPSGVLYLERAAHTSALGLSAVAAVATRNANSFPPQTPWEHFAIGRAYLGAGDIRRALSEMDRCLARDPASLWANYFRGVCSLRLGETVDASTAFSVCVALSPRSAWSFYSRGVAYSESGHLERAFADFNQAIALDGGFTPAILGRAIVHSRAGRYPDALADLRLALAGGLNPSIVNYHTATVHFTAGDKASAISALRECLAHNPAHREARDMLDRLTH